MSTCARCGQFFKPSADDPVVTASSLGAGEYHHACAKQTWEEQAAQERERAEKVRKARSEAARARFGKSGLGRRRVLKDLLKGESEDAAIDA